MSVKQNLIKARALVAAGWIQHRLARIPSGNGILGYSELVRNNCAVPAPEGTCFCAVGAVLYSQCLPSALDSEAGPELRLLANAIPAHEGWRPLDPRSLIEHFNDSFHTNQDDVLAVFDRAIESAPC